VRHRASEHRLRASRRALDQHVPAGDRGDQEQLDGRVLPDDGLRDLLLGCHAELAQARERRLDAPRHSRSFRHPASA